MEKSRRASVDRRGIQSLFIPSVPQIVFDTSEAQNADFPANPMPHSRSATELAVSNDEEPFQKRFGSDEFGASNNEDSNSRYNIDLYCSPRLQRRRVFCFDQSEIEQGWLDNGASSNTLGPGSKVGGSTVSLTSEYTARSIGLISNDSSSDSTQFSDKIEQIKQKQNFLRRYASNPEKAQGNMEILVQRSAKSVSNLNSETCQTNDVVSESMDGSICDYVTQSDVQEQMKRFADQDQTDIYSCDQKLITMVTDDNTIKEGRIRQWLTDMGACDD